MGGKRKAAEGRPRQSIDAIIAQARAGASQLPARAANGGGARVSNGLGEAVGYPGASGMPGGGPGTPGSGEAVTSTDTLYANLRWYLVSNLRQVLSEAYVEIGLIQTIVDVPVDDAMRGGVTIKSQQLSEDQIADLDISLERDDDLTTVAQAAKWNRLFGGGAVLVLTDQNPATPLDVEAIGDDALEFRAIDLWELFSDRQTDDSANTNASIDTVVDELDDPAADCYTYYGVKVHKSRVLKLTGIQPPSFIRPRLRGWGISVVETLVRSINQYLKGTDLGFEVLDEFKLDVYKIKGLTNTLLSPGGTAKVAQRVAMANWQKNFQSAMVMDSEDDFDHKQLSFAGLAEAMAGIRMQVAADMRMPLTKLFGISASGFNSGDDDIEVYNAMVEGQIRGRLKHPLLRVIELKCQKLFGFVPDDLSVSFQPLRVLSGVDEETVKTQKFQRLLQAKERGEITSQEFRDACNKGDLFDVTLDTTVDVLDLAAAAGAAGALPQPPAAAGALPTPAQRALPPAAPKANAPAAPSAAASPALANAFDESKIKRAADGKFGSGGGGAKKAAAPAKAKDGGEPAPAEAPAAAPAAKEEAPAAAPPAEAPPPAAAAKEKKTKAKKAKAAALKKGGAAGGGLSDLVEGLAEGVGQLHTLGQRAQGQRRQNADTPIEVLSQAQLLAALTSRVEQASLKPFTTLERFERVLKNSAAFDRASYEADGGDGWIDAGRKEFFSGLPVGADEGLWAKAGDASVAAFGVKKWQFMAWWYRKQGGKYP